MSEVAQIRPRNVFEHLPGALVTRLGPGGGMRSLGDCSVAELRKAIAIQEREVELAAHGLPALRALLQRRIGQGAGEADPAYLPGDDLFDLEPASGGSA